MLYRCRLAEIGGNWLKLAKTVSYVYELLSFFNAFYVISFHSSVVVFCSWNLEVPGSNPVKVNFFLFFFFFWTGQGSNPAWDYIIFSYVESDNLYHLWVFGLITDLYQAKNFLGVLVGISTKVWHLWRIIFYFFLRKFWLFLINNDGLKTWSR